MKIIRQENPLCNQLILDDVEYKLLRAKIYIEQLENDNFSIAHHLRMNALPEEILTAVRRSFTDYTEYPSILKELYSDVSSSLVGVHSGDCTKSPHSCLKCYAEALLGEDTIKLEWVDCRFSLYWMNMAFSNGRTTISDAIEYLEKYHRVTDGITNEQIGEVMRSIEYLKAHNKVVHPTYGSKA